MKQSLTRLLCVLIACLSLQVNAQMLETVDMSPVTGQYDTYVTGINNDGYITGYSVPPGGYALGFIITPQGKRLNINPAGLGVNETKVESINDHGVAIVVGIISGTNSYYKCYLDIANDTIGSIVALTGVQQPNAVPLDINNNNDISGWYQGVQRWLYVQHDSIVPGGNAAWEAKRFSTAGPVYYNTWGSGINDANDVAGFYIDGSLYFSFKYDNLGHTFTTLASPNKVKLWDINNNGWVAGEYQQTNGFWMAFIANTSSGSYTQWTSLDIILEGDTIQSMASGINDNGEVAGSFLHPTTGKWVGFIYHPNMPEYRIPNFNYNQHTWKLDNKANTSTTGWPSSYWNNFNYWLVDPYAYNGFPVIDQFIINSYGSTYLNMNYSNSTSPDWRSYMYEVDPTEIGLNTDYYSQQYYNNIHKHYLFSKYNQYKLPYQGHCYGYTFTALLRHFNDALFSSWYGYPVGTDISAIDNTDTNTTQRVAQMYFKQNDLPTVQKYGIAHYDKITLWHGLYRLKTEYKKPWAQSNPRGMYIGFWVNNFQNIGWHSIMPYKIRTPRKLPFDYPAMKYDTLFVYDSNYPNNDSNQHFTVHSIKYMAGYDSAYNTSYPTLAITSFNEMSVRENYPIQYSTIKTTSGSGNEPQMRFSLKSNLYYSISGTSTQASFDQNGYSVNNTDDFMIVDLKSTGVNEKSNFLIDTNNTVHYTTYNYVDTCMIWSQSNTTRSMGISRAAVLNETDHGMMKSRVISYGNPDNGTKYLNAFLTEVEQNQQQGSSILAQNICAAQGDSIVVENPTPYVLKITKVVGTANCTYDLTIFAAYNGDSVKEFHSPIELTGNTSHTIDPYVVGNNGEQIGVIIDNGLDGIPDDTLFVAGFPVNMNSIVVNDGIRLYPNPTSSDLNLEFSANHGDYTIYLTDAIGRTVYSQAIAANAARVNISMTAYSAGAYLVHITDKKGQIVFRDKIIKQ